MSKFIVTEWPFNHNEFNTYEEVRNDLIKSKGKILIHPARRVQLEEISNNPV